MMNKIVSIDFFADEIVQKLQDAIKTKANATLVVSGGSTPIKLFEKLSQIEFDWQKVTILLCDERCVQSSNKDSNANLVRTHLLKDYAKVANFFPLYDDISIETSIKKAPKNLDIDIIILGMGNDGHTASLFPNNEKLKSAYDLKSENSYIHITPSTAPYERISMTLKTILSAKNIYLHIEGESKKAVLENAFRHGDIYQYPILSVLTQPNKKVEVYYA